MARLFTIPALIAACLISDIAGITAACARDESVKDEPTKVESAKADEFNTRLFGAPLSKKTTYACFTRRYDANHLAQHPKQKVAAMKLLVMAEYPPLENQSPYSFRLGFNYRNSKAKWESMGYCGHIRDTASGTEVQMNCGVECDGGSIQIGLAKDANATLVRLERVRIWQNASQDEDSHALVGGTDDKLFRLERTDLKDCESLVEDRDERLAMQAK